MNFINVIHYPIFGGPHNRVCRLRGALEKRGFNTLVLLPNERGNATERLIKYGVPFITISLHRLRATLNVATHFIFLKNFFGEVNKIREVIRKRKIKFILISGLANMHGALAGSIEKVPVIWQITDSRTPRLLQSFMAPLVRKLSDSVMFNGNSLLESHVNKFSFKVPYVVYYPPVDTHLFNKSTNSDHVIKQKLGIPEDDIIIGMVANLNPQKGIEYFIRAASLVYRSIPNCSFLIIGAHYETHNKYNKLIEKEITKSIVPRNKFIIAGEIYDIENYYPIMDVKLITSVPRSEGTTTTAIEAMACGIPVVATDVGSVREVVEHGKTGFVVPPLDHKAIAAASLHLLKDHELRRKMGAEARRRAVERYDVEICADTHVRAFEAAIAHHRFKRS